MTEDEMVGWHRWDISLSKFWKIEKDREAWRTAVHRVTESGTRVSNQTPTLA